MSGEGSCSARCAGVILAAALAGTPLTAGSDAAKERFSKALAEAKANLATSEGHAYDGVLAVYFQQQNALLLEGCMKATPKPDLTAFEIVLRVAASGSVLDAFVWPETKLGLCLADGLKAKTFPLPPREAYWTQMRMSFGP